MAELKPAHLIVCNKRGASRPNLAVERVLVHQLGPTLRLHIASIILVKIIDLVKNKNRAFDICRNSNVHLASVDL